jgi:hypothetical protein
MSSSLLVIIPYAFFLGPQCAHALAQKTACARCTSRAVLRPTLQVVVIEQTENPEMLKARNEQRAQQGLAKVRAATLPSFVAEEPGSCHPAAGQRSQHPRLLFGSCSGMRHQEVSREWMMHAPPFLPCSTPVVQDMVVRREKVAVLTQGTLTDAEMLAGLPEAAYLLALAELPVPGGWRGGWRWYHARRLC